MKVYVTRSSVAASDDVDVPHARQFTFPDDSSTEDILNKIVKAGYLASIASGHAADPEAIYSRLQSLARMEF